VDEGETVIALLGYLRPASPEEHCDG